MWASGGPDHSRPALSRRIAWSQAVSVLVLVAVFALAACRPDGGHDGIYQGPGARAHFFTKQTLLTLQIFMGENTYATKWKQATPMPSSIFDRTRSYFRHVALSALSAANLSMDRYFLRCLYCHNVFDDQVDEFDHLVSALKRVGTFVDTRTFLEMVKGELPIDGRYYHMSFDDGFRNNYTNAFPILRKHNIPCIFFVPSALMSANWKETEQYCLETTRYKGVIELLRWSDLSEMISAGYDIGSHTRTHACFSAISHDRALLDNEILGSKQEIEASLNTPCDFISWPYGRVTDADVDSLQAARDAGYHACFGAFRGSIIPNQTDIFSIPRHHFEPSWPISHIQYFARGNMEKT